jgi:hypothetical protein
MDRPFPAETHQKTRHLSSPHLEYVNAMAFFRCCSNIPLEKPFSRDSLCQILLSNVDYSKYGRQEGV